jgi:hypothetical protein
MNLTAEGKVANRLSSAVWFFVLALAVSILIVAMSHADFASVTKLNDLIANLVKRF